MFSYGWEICNDNSVTWGNFAISESLIHKGTNLKVV